MGLRQSLVRRRRACRHSRSSDGSTRSLASEQLLLRDPRGTKVPGFNLSEVQSQRLLLPPDIPVLAEISVHRASQLQVLKEGLTVVGHLRDLVPHASESLVTIPSLVRQDEGQTPGGLSIDTGEPGERGLDELDALADRGQLAGPSSRAWSDGSMVTSASARPSQSANMD